MAGWRLSTQPEGNDNTFKHVLTNFIFVKLNIFHIDSLCSKIKCYSQITQSGLNFEFQN